MCVFRRKYMLSATVIPVRPPARPAQPARQPDGQPARGFHEPPESLWEMQTVFQQEHAAYNPLLRQSPTAAAEWAKPRESAAAFGSTRRGESCRMACQTIFVDSFSETPIRRPRATRPTGPSELRFPELENPRRK